MCVIFHKQAGKVVEEKDIVGGMETNTHGFGFMYFVPETKTIVARKGLFKNKKTVLKCFKEAEPYEAAFHFRIRTHGEISDAACHPFEICNKKDHGIQMYMMHNGTIGNVFGQANESDTQQFVNNFMKPMLQNNPYFIETPAFKKMVEDYIGSFNKLLFMYGDEGKVLRLNNERWLMHDGMNVSNKCFVDYRADPVVDYIKNAYSQRKGAWSRADTIAVLQRKKEEDAEKGIYYFCSAPVKLGSLMYMTHSAHEYWWSQGIIKSIDGWQCEVEFPNVRGETITGKFYTQSGVGNYMAQGYQAMPMARPVANIDKTIAALGKEIDKLNAKALTEEEAEDAALKAVEPLRLEDKKKETQQETTAESSSTTPQTSPPVDSSEAVSFEVSHNGTTVDCKNRWCAGFNNSTQAFGDGTSVLDIFHMDRNERFRWYNENVETAYNMFLDMVEKVVYDDQECGLLNETFDAVADDVDPEEDTAEEERKVAEMAMAWEGFSCGG